MRTSHIVAALAVAAFSAPVAAADKASDNSSASATQAVAKQKKYCLEEALTGSRMRQKQCLTKDEWAKRGIDIDETLRR